MILAAHQPDLFPWTGFWHKVAKADVFDVAIWDQINWRGYTHRVLMRGSWSTLAVRDRSSGTRIADVRLDQYAADQLYRDVKGRYQGSPNWEEHGPMVLQWLDESRAELLWQFNLALLLHVRDFLGLKTPLAVAGQPQGDSAMEKLLWLCDNYGGSPADDLAYLAGSGGRSYMGERPEQVFHGNGFDLQWTAHKPWTEESILTTIFDKEDPMAWVMAEEVPTNV